MLSPGPEASIAPVYDQPFLQQWIYRPPHDEVIARLREHQSRRIADIACGTGILGDRIERELHPRGDLRGRHVGWDAGPRRALDPAGCSGCAAPPSSCRLTTAPSTRS